MADLARLVVRFEAETAKLQAELGRTRKQLDRFGKDSKKSIGAVGVAFGILAADVARQTIVFAKAQIDAADSISKLSQSTGVAVEALSAFDFALDISGGDTADLTKGLNQLARSSSDAARGLEADADAFAAIGVEFRDADGNLRNTEQLLLDVAEAFSASADGAAKSAIAQELFGRSGTKLIPFLNEGREGLAALREEAEELGIVLDENTAKSAEEFNDNLTRLSRVGQGVLLEVLKGLLPALEELSAIFVSASKNAGQFERVGEGVASVLQVLTTGATVVAAQFEFIGKAIAGFAAANVAILRGEFGEAINVVKLTFADLKDTAVDALDTVVDIWDGSEQKITGSAEAIEASVDDVVKKQLVFEKGAGKVAAGNAAIKDSITPVLDALQLEVDTLGQTREETELYKLALEGATETQLDYAQSLFDTVAAFDAEQQAQQDAAAAAEELDAIAARRAEIIDGVDSATREYTATLEDLNALLTAGRLTETEYDAAAVRAKEAFEEAGNAGRAALFDLQAFGADAANSLQDSFADFLFAPFDDGLEGMVKGFGSSLQRMIADAVAADLFGRLGGAGGTSGVSGGLAGVGSLFAGFFDGGGTVPAGQFGIAGENGPELVFEGQSVVSTRDTAAMMGGTNNVTVNVAPQNSSADMRRAAGQGAREALDALKDARRYG